MKRSDNEVQWCMVIYVIETETCWVRLVNDNRSLNC